MLDKKILEELQQYIDQHLEPLALYEKSNKYNADYDRDIILESISPIEIEDFIKEKREPTFKEVLFKLIDKKGATDADIYKKAGIDRRHFSKIRNNSAYKPGKNSVIALALALELNKKETGKLLSSAGYSLSDNDTFDLVIQFCIEKNIYDIYQVNQALVYFSLKPIGGVL